MKKCVRCNIIYEDDKKFCRNCGSPLRPEIVLDPDSQAKKEVFEARLRQNPLNKEVLQKYAEFLFEKELWDECIAIVFKKLAIDPDDIAAHLLLLESYKKLEKLDDALTTGEKLISLKPKNALFILRSLVDIASAKGDHNTALRYLDKIIEMAPSDKDAWIEKAETQGQIGLQEDSASSWQKVYELDPSHPKAQIYAGIAEYEKQHYSEAARLIEAGVNKADLKLPEKISAELILALSKVKIGELEEDVEKLEWVDSYSLNDKAKALLAELYVHVAEKLLAINNYEKALHYLSKARQLRENDDVLKLTGRAYFLQAKELLENHSYRNAENFLLKALECEPGNAEYDALLAKVRSYLKAKSRKKKALAFCFFFLVIAIGTCWYLAHGEISIKINAKSKVELFKGDKVLLVQENTDHFLKKFLFLGNYSVKISSEGYKPYFGNIKISWLTKLRKKIDLIPRFGSLKIDSRPSGLSVYVDGTKVGITPATVPKVLAKTHHIEIKGNGYYWSQMVHVEEGKVADIGKPVCAFSLSNLSPQQIMHPDPKELSYHADFEKYNGGWRSENDKKHFIKLRGGKLIFGTKNYYSYSAVPYKADQYSNFVYGAKLRKISKGYRDSYYGIMFRVRKAGRSWLLFFFGVNDAGGYILRARTMDSWSSVELEKGKLHYPIDGKTVLLAVEAIDDRIKCFVDGKLVCRMKCQSDRIPTYGMIGIDITSPKITVAYDDLFVREIPYLWRFNKLVYKESFDRVSKHLRDITDSKFAKIKGGQLHYVYWRGWAWDSFLDVKEDSYSVSLEGSARGKEVCWGPVILARTDVSYDGNQKIEKSYSLNLASR